MAVLNEIRRRAKQVAPQVLAACTVAYFLFHAVQGDRGFLAYLQLTQDLKQARAHAETVAAERAALEARVASLRPESLDPDMLEERARLLLDYAEEGDVVIFLPRHDERPERDSNRN